MLVLLQALVDEFNSPAHPSFVLLLSSKVGPASAAGTGAARARSPARVPYGVRCPPSPAIAAPPTETTDGHQPAFLCTPPCRPAAAV